MVSTISIKNYALIEDVQVHFKNGFTTITGETGAGKSILLGALGLLFGKRADLKILRDTQRKCVVEGVVNISKYDLKSFFETNDLDYEITTIIRREILPQGKSRAFINDTPVTVAQLQDLGAFLIDIHSQNDTLNLASTNFQFNTLDIVSKSNNILEQYTDHYKILKKSQKKLEALLSQQAEAIKEQDYISFLFNELKAINLTTINQEALEETLEKLNNTELIQENLLLAKQILEEEQIGGLVILANTRAALAKIKNINKEYQGLWERLNSIYIETQDISENLENALEEVTVDPELLEKINQKLQQLYKLQQKHQVNTVQDLINVQENLNQQLENFQSLDEEIKNLEKIILEAKNQAQICAEQLHQKREKGAKKLEEELKIYLTQLGLPQAQFNITIEKTTQLTIQGANEINWLFSANKGLPLASVSKVASGGETSRIMLGLKAILAKYKKMPTIVFDEIDTGVSGEIAHKIADILLGMSQNVQILSITHLPQIAAKGQHHKKVYKEDGAIVQTKIKDLDKEQRIVEIASMIGGQNITQVALDHAEQLLT